jgi:hyperosmotically inducible protein
MLTRMAARLCLVALMAALATACAQTDPGITTSVKSKLAADDTVKAYEVNVDTSQGVVTLSGEVGTMAAKERAVTIARETDGVKDVVDNLQVAPEQADIDRDDDVSGTTGEAGAAISDAAITTVVKAKFAADSDVRAYKIDVDTSHGVVTLTGNVRSATERDRAIELAKDSDGVKQVIDRLDIGESGKS